MSALQPKGAIQPWWRRTLIVLAKEMRDHLRDRRSLWLALVYPLLGPLVIGLLLELSADSMRNGPESRAMTVTARGLEFAPDLANYLARNRVLLVSGDTFEPTTPGARDPVVLEIPPEARHSDQYTVRLRFDGGNAVAVGMARQLSDLVTSYGRQISQRILTAHGLDPSLLQPITIERVPFGRRFNVASLFYGLIPPLMVFMIFLGAVYLALDSTVGERERGTLEPLLTAPVRRWELLLGKAGAALLFTLATVVLNLTAFRIVLGVLAATLPGVENPPPTATFLLIFAMALPVMVLAVTVQLTVGTLSRSTKEAQIYLGLLPLLPALPGLASAMSPMAPKLWIAATPVLGQMVAFGRLITGGSVDPLHALLSLTVTLAAAALLFLWAIRLFDRECTVMPE